MSLLPSLSPLAIAVLLALPAAASAHSPRYKVVQVGVAGSVANDINSSGAVVGNFPFSTSATHGFANIGGVITDLGTLGGPDSYAAAINDANVIVGTSINTDGYRRAFRYQDGAMADLGTLGGNNSGAGDINNRGDIAGSADDGPDSALEGRAFLLRPGSPMHDLGRIEVPDAEGTSSALGLNELRQVAGGSVVGPYTPPESMFHAFLYKCEEMIDLGTLGGQYSIARAINERTQVVGETSTAEFRVSRAFLWYRGTMRSLGTLPGGDLSSATDINDHGKVVGYATLPGVDGSTGPQVGFLYSSGKMRDLNTLIDRGSGWFVVNAEGINNSGQIAATGCKGSTCYAVRLDPLP